MIDLNTVGLLTAEETYQLTKRQQENRQCLRIPRRPDWDLTMSAEQLEKLEYEQFIIWRKQLADASENKNLMFTPFEKNLEFWRQLWRVIERSDVIVQILDARNPLLFYCEDIHTYAKEVGKDKVNVLLLNKSDYLTEQQRQHWANYFDSNRIRALFFSALDPTGEENSKEKDDDKESAEKEDKDDENEDSDVEKKDSNAQKESGKEEKNNEGDELKEARPEEISAVEEYISKGKNSSRLFSRSELIEILCRCHTNGDSRYKKDYLTVGLVGYPNVGKSSTINALLECKKVSISSTPGKTKHFQTIFLDKQLCLCDCPGLVFPNFVTSKAEMIINGILPIDQIRDFRPPINLLVTYIPLRVFQSVYSLILPSIKEISEKEFITSDQLLNAYSLMKGFVTGRGLPDHAKSAKCLIKDFVTGHLLYCWAPPSVDQNHFQPYDQCPVKFAPKHITPFQQRVIRDGLSREEFDAYYFSRLNITGKVKGINGYSTINSFEPQSESKHPGQSNKPWKELNKLKRNKREKLRRVFRYLDEH